MRDSVLAILFALDIVLLVLLAIGFQFTTPGTTEHAISIVSLVVIVCSLVMIGAAIRMGVTLFDP